VREKNGDPGAIRTRVRSQTNRLTPVGLLHSRPPVRRPLPPNFFPKLGRVMRELSFERKFMVTRARFERASGRRTTGGPVVLLHSRPPTRRPLPPSFGGFSGNRL